MRKTTRWLATLATLPVLALAGCGGDEEEPTAAGGGEGGGAQNTEISGNVQVAAVWTGAEQESFQAVLDAFQEQYPNVNVRYNPAGDQLPTVLSTAVEGGNPPDVAMIAQPGLVQQFVDRGALQPLDFARDTIEQNFSEDFVQLGTFNDELYGLLFKGANKSLIWYNTGVYEAAGVQPPATWDELMTAADTVQASGVPMYSIAGADGWTLTDLFENIYLRTAGPELYDQLATHEIPWTHPSVQEALGEMAKIFEDEDNIAGGARGALQVDFPESVNQVFSENPEAATVMEGDFVQGVIEEAGAEEGSYGVAPFPEIGDSGSAVVGGGDMVVMFNDTPAAQALVEYLASPAAAEVWAQRGGFASPNQNLDPSVYPDETTRQTATALAEAETFRFDMSDLAPAAFGGTPGEGEWRILQDFLADASNTERTAQQLERAAARAFE